MDDTVRARPEPWITAEEAADHLGYAIGTLYNKVADGSGPPHRRLGRNLRFRRSELDAWVEAQNEVPAPAEEVG